MLKLVLFLSIFFNSTRAHAMLAKPAASQTPQPSLPGSYGGQAAKRVTGSLTAPKGEAKAPAKAPTAPLLAESKKAFFDDAVLEKQVLDEIIYALDVGFSQHAFIRLMVYMKECCLEKKLNFQKILSTKIAGCGTLIRRAIQRGHPTMVLTVLAHHGAPICYANSKTPDFEYAWNCWENKDRENILKWLLEQDIPKPYISDWECLNYFAFGISAVGADGNRLCDMIDRCIAQMPAIRKTTQEQDRCFVYLEKMVERNTLKHYGVKSRDELRKIIENTNELARLVQGLEGLEVR